MKLLYSFAQFIMSEWIWSFTFAFYHPLINIIVMIPLFVFYAKQRVVNAVLYAVTSQLYAIAVFTLLTHVVLNILLQIPFQDYNSTMIHSFWACVLLAVIYAGLQISLFYIMRHWYRFSIKRFTTVVLVSNVISALIIYKFLPNN